MDLNDLLKELEAVEARGRRTLYKMNQTITPEDIEIIRDYFVGHPMYVLTLKQCKLYENSWDIMLTIVETEK